MRLFLICFFINIINAVDEHAPLRGVRDQRWSGDPTAKICSFISGSTGITRYVIRYPHLTKLICESSLQLSSLPGTSRRSFEDTPSVTLRPGAGTHKSYQNAPASAKTLSPLSSFPEPIYQNDRIYKDTLPSKLIPKTKVAKRDTA